MVTEDQLKYVVVMLTRLIARGDADATAVRLLLSEKGLIQHDEFQIAREEVLRHWDRRFAEHLAKESETSIEDLLKGFEGPIQ